MLAKDANGTLLRMALTGCASGSGEGQALPPHIALMQLSTPKLVTGARKAEFKQDFVNVDFSKDDNMDAEEVRAHFKGGIVDVELFQFFLDSDKDQSRTVSLQAYVDYAAMLN